MCIEDRMPYYYRPEYDSYVLPSGDTRVGEMKVDHMTRYSIVKSENPKPTDTLVVDPAYESVYSLLELVAGDGVQIIYDKSSGNPIKLSDGSYAAEVTDVKKYVYRGVTYELVKKQAPKIWKVTPYKIIVDERFYTTWDDVDEAINPAISKICDDNPFCDNEDYSIDLKNLLKKMYDIPWTDSPQIVKFVLKEGQWLKAETDDKADIMEITFKIEIDPSSDARKPELERPKTFIINAITSKGLADLIKTDIFKTAIKDWLEDQISRNRIREVRKFYTFNSLTLKIVTNMNGQKEEIYLIDSELKTALNNMVAQFEGGHATRYVRYGGHRYRLRKKGRRNAIKMGKELVELRGLKGWEWSDMGDIPDRLGHYVALRPGSPIAPSRVGRSRNVLDQGGTLPERPSRVGKPPGTSRSGKDPLKKGVMGTNAKQERSERRRPTGAAIFPMMKSPARPGSRTRGNKK
jgi:hypothetical protein